MPAGRNTKGQNGQDHEPNVPWGWMHENFRVLRWPGRSFFLTSPFIELRDLSLPIRRNATNPFKTW